MPNDAGKACLHCGQILDGAYCRVCGQSAEVERYSAKAFAREVYHAIRKFDITTTAVTVLELLIRPGAFVRDYLAGKRVGFANPVKFFFYSFIAEILVRTTINQLAGPNFVPDTQMTSTWVQMFDFAATVFWGVLWRLFFPSSGLNAAECAVSALFFQGQTTFLAVSLLLLTIPLRYFVPVTVAYLDLIDLIVTTTYSYFFAVSLFRDSIFRTVVKQTILLILFFTALFAGIVGLMLIGFWPGHLN